ncbi:MAG: amino acid adenylation domain-containing protein, partial [Actinocatenispora sp.]
PLPMRIAIPRAAPVRDWLAGIMRDSSALAQFAHTPPARIAEWCAPSGGPLFDTVLATPAQGAVVDEGEGAAVPPAPSAARYPLTVTAGPAADGSLRIILEHDPRVVEPAVVGYLADHLVTILGGMAGGPDLAVGGLPALGATERAELARWSAGPSRPPTAWLPVTIERVAAELPDAVAIEQDGATVTFRDLLAGARAVARGLRASGVAGGLVAIESARGADAVVAMLGAWYAGSAYLPLDPEIPAARRAEILDQARPRLLVTTTTGSPDTPAGGRGLPRSSVTELVAAGAAADTPGADDTPVAAPGLDDAAYVIFTSGSTGVPKGVVVGHRSLANFVADMVDRYRLGPADRGLLGASIGVDFFVGELFPLLAAGATAVVRRPDAYTDMRVLLDQVATDRITVLNLATAVWHQLTREIADGARLADPVRVVEIGGERAVPALLDLWRRGTAGAVPLYNGYGPTEATVAATSCQLTGSGRPDLGGWTEVPIGRPLANTHCLVLDDDGREAPVGAVGELHLAGDCLALGYLDDAALTADRFVADPRVPGGRRYRTGDLVRWNAAGQLEYHGRTDGQLKIAGHRVETAEIERALLSFEGIREVWVSTRASADGEVLGCDAHLVGAVDLDLPAVRGHVSRLLPPAVVPIALSQVESLPRTVSHKVSPASFVVRATDEPASGPDTDEPASGPGTVADGRAAALAEAFAEVLGHRELDGGFYAAGGNSLLAMRVLSRLRKESGVQLTVRRLVTAPSLNELIHELTAADGDPTAPSASGPGAGERKANA